MDIFENERNNKPVIETVEKLSESISPSKDLFNKVLDKGAERFAKIDSIISEKTIDKEFSASEFVNRALKTEKIKPSDLLKTYDDILRRENPEIACYSPETYVSQLMFGKLDYTNITSTDILASFERNLGVNKTYAIANDLGIIPEVDVNTGVIDILDKELSATSIAHFFQDVLGY